MALSMTVFDEEAMLKRLMGDVEHAVDLVGLYQQHGPELVQAVCRSATNGDMAGLAGAAHKLQGATSHVHGECLKQVAGQLECLARANHQLEAVALLQDLEHAWRELHDALGAFLQSPPLC